MLKKFATFVMIVFILFSLSACGYTTNKFESLDKIQEVLSADFYYFNLDTEVFGEAKEFSATQNSMSDFDGTHYFSYSILYDIENVDSGQTYRFKIVGTHTRKPFKILAPKIDSIIIDKIQISLRHDDNSQRGFELSQKGDFLAEFTLDEYFYCYVLSGSKYPLDKTELDYFKYICELAILNRYKK